jgi:hypothetical protein
MEISNPIFYKELIGLEASENQLDEKKTKSLQTQ